MNIEHKRIFNCPTYCISRMYIDGEWVCDMVEDTDRGLDQDDRVIHQTAGQLRLLVPVAAPHACDHLVPGFFLFLQQFFQRFLLPSDDPGDFVQLLSSDVVHP